MLQLGLRTFVAVPSAALLGIVTAGIVKPRSDLAGHACSSGRSCFLGIASCCRFECGDEGDVRRVRRDQGEREGGHESERERAGGKEMTEKRPTTYLRMRRRVVRIEACCIHYLSHASKTKFPTGREGGGPPARRVDGTVAAQRSYQVQLPEEGGVEADEAQGSKYSDDEDVARCLRSMVREEGWGALYRGWMVCLFDGILLVAGLVYTMLDKSVVHRDTITCSAAMVSSAAHAGKAASAKDVVVIGAGPAGAMLGANLARLGVNVDVLDERSDKTSTGRADGIQPKTLETFKQMRVLEPLLQKGVKFYDMMFWHSDASTSLRRTGRETHYPSPDVIDVLEPYMLLGHQGMVEDALLDDMAAHRTHVTRNAHFTEFNSRSGSIDVSYEDSAAGSTLHLQTAYLVGCDGAHSNVRKCMPNTEMVGESKDIIWGVLDGEIDTEFPDLWSKTIVQSKKYGTILCIPRERNMTRLYIELISTGENEKITKAVANQQFVMQRARDIFAPYKLNWTFIGEPSPTDLILANINSSEEWFGLYQIGQRVANRFMDDSKRVFITGDAGHTHSPKAGQGMNVSMHDSWNLAWKLNLAVRGLAAPALLPTYEAERRKIATDLIHFDHEHAEAFSAGDPKKLAENFATNTRFISGVGADYSDNVLNQPLSSPAITGDCRPGKLLTPGKVTRYVDHNPVDLQLDIPHLGQFRIFMFCATVQAFEPSPTSPSFLGRVSAAASASYKARPRPMSPQDEFSRPERYFAASDLFTFGVITTQPKDSFEIADLPPLLAKSRWTIYLDNVPDMDTKKMRCADKWAGGVREGEVVVVNVRPDGYVGSVARWKGTADDGRHAVGWLERYYGGFLQADAGTKISAKL
ncbi:hypothetical protein OE88DRAFT_1643825 [Heliocybe sulcata]|uniref:FAD binding domain-containing protein n=1 Tax=Heliocybe sulcata TaxID=5364 RepID=A0A5C3N638_9AGAM|nr:hypothetical protein OE88DRAFT_1643825 [Heliocybe sulcata]